MKTFLKNAFGYPVFIWFGLFVLLNALLMQITPIGGYPSQTIIWTDVVLNLILKVVFMGYLFNVAIRVAQKEPTISTPIQFKKSFILGFKLLGQFLFISIPLIAVYIAILMTPDETSFLYGAYYRLIYLAFVLIPYSLFIVKSAPQTPLLNGFVGFFKKNAGHVFAFIFWLALTFLAWQYFFELMANAAFIYSTSLGWMMTFVMIPYFVLFQVSLLSAWLLGVFARKCIIVAATPVIEKEVPVIAPVMEKTAVKKVAKSRAGTAKKTVRKTTKSKAKK